MDQYISEQKQLEKYEMCIAIEFERMAYREFGIDGKCNVNIVRDASGRMICYLRKHLASEVLSELKIVDEINTEFIEIPYDWWESFKVRWFPTVVRFGLMSIKYKAIQQQTVTTKQVQVQALYHDVYLPDNRHSIIVEKNNVI